MASKKQNKKQKSNSKNVKSTPVVEPIIVEEVNSVETPVEATDSWWESDSVKTVATVIAVLLIPAAIIAWNSMSQSEFASDTEATLAASEELEMNLDDITLDQTEPTSNGNVQDTQPQTDKNIIVVVEPEGQSMEQEQVAIGETSPVDPISETENVDSGNTDPVIVEDESSRPSIIRMAAITLFFKNIANRFQNLLSNREENLAEIQEEENSTETEDTEVVVEENTMEESVTEPSEDTNMVDSTNEETVSDVQTDTGDREQDQQVEQEQPVVDNTAQNNSENNDKPVTIDNVTELPNTSSEFKYTVEKGDNVYKISMKVCGNDSFYTNNMYKDYLKVGQEITVSCN